MSQTAGPILPALFPEQNPSPVLRMSRDGTLLYANAGAAFLLEDWHCSVGDCGPECLREAVASALEEGAARGVEIQSRDRDISFVVAPLAGLACANLYGHDVTSRKQAEQRYRALFDQMTEGFALCEIICDVRGEPRDYRFLEINPAFERLTRLKQQEVTGRTLKEVLPDAEPVWVRRFGAVALTGEPVRFDQWEESLGRHYAVFAYRPATNQFAVVFQDITQRKRAEEALRESEGRFRQVVESLPQMVWTCQADGPCDYLSPQWLCYTGKPEGTQLGYGWLDQLHPGDRDRVVTAWRSTAQKGEDFDIEFRIRRYDGVYRWFRTLAVPLRDGAGRLVKWFGSNTDIQDIKEAEQALRQSREDLTRAQEVGQIGSWRLDVRRNILTWSDETHRIFGIPPETPLSYETFLSTVHPDDRSYVDRKWKAGLRGEPYDVEHRLLVDGRVKWVREKAYLEFDESGELLGGFGITQDITERKLIEEERAREARLKDEFLALLGHELRNPLAAISTAVRLLSNRVTAERRRSLQEMVGRQVTVLQRLVDDLLDLARITHGQIDLKKEPVDLAELLQRATAAARSSVAGRGQELVLRMPSERVLFVADGVRLEQIATNLLNNASKYTGQGGRIELSGAREGSEVVIRCKDNGRGIPLGMQRMIFEPFARGQTAGESTEAGIGIGLTLVKRLAELHGGTVTVESAGAGAGSEFTVRIPLLTPPPASREVRAAGTLRTVRGRSVAIVEDNADVAQALAIGLEQAGYKVRRFADGLSALSGLTRLKPHAILLDIGLPGMDGYELAARLRKKQNLKRALFVGISGFKRRAQGGKTRDGFDQYFVKPVDLDKLLAFLEMGTSRAKPPQVRGSVKPPRVLLVEDNAGLAEVTAEMLRREGLDVRIALSGREALETAADYRPQLTLCDLRLPDMPGQEVLQALRSKPATRRTHAVILTALHESEVRMLRRQAKAMGVDQVLSKPLTSGKLQELMRTLKKHQG